MAATDGSDEAHGAARARQGRVPADFMTWVEKARQIVGDHFPAETLERHNELVIQTANALMLTHRLGEIEDSLEGLRSAIVTAIEGAGGK